MSRYARWSYEEWYDEVLAIAASWSVHPADLNAVSESFFVASWRKGDSPERAIFSALQDVSQPMDLDGRITGWDA